MTAALITPPAIEPVQLADAKAYLRVDNDDEDDFINAAVAAARMHVETLTRRVLIQQSWRVYLDSWPRTRVVTIPVAPLIAVESVTVYDRNGEPTTLSPDDYQVDTTSVPGRLMPYATVPLAERTINGIEIDVTAGYGAAGIDVPSPLRQAMMMLIAHWFEHRGVVGHDLAGDVPPHGFDALVAPYRILSL
jgi:uncharacterized phiE125 gp8 family phage protein